ncbi:MAG TPA: hypothetical protein VF467_08030 [Afipia sp.]
MASVVVPPQEARWRRGTLSAMPRLPDVQPDFVRVKLSHIE